MGEGYYGYRLLLLFLILALNGFFAAAEVSLVSVRKSTLRHLAEKGHVGAQAALSLLERPERLLSVTQFGVTLASLLLGWAGEDTLYQLMFGALSPFLTGAMAKTLHVLCFMLAFTLMSFAHVILGEVVPKNLALEKAGRLAILSAPALLVFDRISRPFVFTIERTASAISRLLGLTGKQHGGGHSPEELRHILSSSREEGHLPEFEESAIQRLLDLQEYYVREIMTPRNAIVSLPIGAGLDQVLREMIEHKFSRLPVYEGTPEQIVGFVHYKDLLTIWEERRLSNMRRRNVRPFHLKPFLRKPTVVPETKPLNQMLEEFRGSHVHMAMVVDEFGTITGIVTLEDVLEQIVGPIEDEYDERRLHGPQIEATMLELDGATTIRNLETQYGLELPSDAGFETLAGYILFELGRIPQVGDSVEHGLRRFTVIEMDRNRIARVRMQKISAEEQTAVSQ